MPLTHAGKKIEHAMEKEYGEKKGKSVFYAKEHKSEKFKHEVCKHCGSKHHKSHEHHSHAKTKALERMKK